MPITACRAASPPALLFDKDQTRHASQQQDMCKPSLPEATTAAAIEAMCKPAGDVPCRINHA